MLRPYQQDAIGGITKAHEGGHIPLCVMATGTGKTHVFVEYAKTTRSRVMIVAERSEIVLQAREKVDSVGETVGVEMGQMTVQEMIWGRPRFVCASIQTLNSIRRGQRRMNKFDWNSFSLLVIDEAHHAVSPSYRRLIDLARTENPDILVLGVTATPDRLDKQGMNKVFTKVAYKYEMLQAINDGYLCPISQRLVTVKSLDFTDVKTAQGDLSISDLDRVMRYEKNLHGVVMPTLEISGDRQTLIFASSIKHAERMAEIINRHKPDQAVIITGKLEADERAAGLRDSRLATPSTWSTSRWPPKAGTARLCRASPSQGRPRAVRCIRRWWAVEPVPLYQSPHRQLTDARLRSGRATSQTASSWTLLATRPSTSWSARLIW